MTFFLVFDNNDRKCDMLRQTTCHSFSLSILRLHSDSTSSKTNNYSPSENSQSIPPAEKQMTIPNASFKTTMKAPQPFL